jgi:hypothetical protein
MILSASDDDLWDAKDILNFFMRRPFESDNAPPIILKELPISDQILVLNFLSNYYPIDYKYNFRIFQKLCIALIKNNQKALAFDVADAAISTKRISTDKGKELKNLISEFQNNNIEYIQSDYNKVIESMENKLKPEKLEIYASFGMQKVVQEYVEILIEFCKKKLEHC